MNFPIYNIRWSIMITYYENLVGLLDIPDKGWKYRAFSNLEMILRIIKKHVLNRKFSIYISMNEWVNAFVFTMWNLEKIYTLIISGFYSFLFHFWKFYWTKSRNILTIFHRNWSTWVLEFLCMDTKKKRI